jgi:hypothetical protein
VAGSPDSVVTAMRALQGFDGLTVVGARSVVRDAWRTLSWRLGDVDPTWLAVDGSKVVDGVSVVVTRSQVAFPHRRGFAYVWRPGQYVDNDAPAVLSIALPHAPGSRRRTRLRDDRRRCTVSITPVWFASSAGG